MQWEYAEDYASLMDGWTELLNQHGDEGWELVAVILDETDIDGRTHEGRYRLVFKRVAEDED